MIAIEGVFSKKNLEQAFFHFDSKNHSEKKANENPYREMWELNGERIFEEAFQCTYKPDLIKEYEIIKSNGKRRTVANFSDMDKLITRLLAQKLNEFYNNLFCENSFAYQPDKGIQKAIEKVKEYVESGNEYVVEIDLRNYFDTIPLDRLIELISEQNRDKRVLSLIKGYLFCTVSNAEKVYEKQEGLIQGSSMSPVLSNLYLHGLDLLLEQNQYNFIRFADNIYVYTSNKEKAMHIYQDIERYIIDDINLQINESKSGVYDAFSRRVLGYDLQKRGKNVIVRRHRYQKSDNYSRWHASSVQIVNKEYHIIQSGILNKKDYSLLFENTDEKHHIPVEATEQLDLYNEVVITSGVINTLSRENVRLAFYEKYGNLLGYFVPESYVQDTNTLLIQCENYCSQNRIMMARKFEIAYVHNMRANVRYYSKHKKELLKECIDFLTESIKRINESSTVEQMMLEEARCRQKYYQTFRYFITREGYEFERRTKRPPMDRINALISFGNTLLYNRIQQFIWRTSLDSRIGVVHAANRRHYSLNLDFADIFKPIIVDRVIFTLINKGMLDDDSFVTNLDGSVYLSGSGKKLFIEAFQTKMYSKLKKDGKQFTYNQIVEREIRNYQSYVREKKKYQPYKYY